MSKIASTGTPVTHVVVAYRSERLLAGCLDSIAADMSGSARILVVDNASPDASAEIAASHPTRPTVLRSDVNVGFGAACNLAAAHAPSDQILFLVNPDARLRANATRSLLRVLEENPCAGAVGAGIIDPARSYRAASAGFEPSLRAVIGHYLLLGRIPLLARMFPPLQLPAGSGPQIVDWVSGAGMMIRHDAYAMVGGFDGRMFLYMEDVDLCRRLRAAGWTVHYEPSATIEHALGGSQGAEQARRWYRAFHAYLVARHGQRYARAASAIAAVGLGLRAIMLRPVRPAHARRLGRAAITAAGLAIQGHHQTIDEGHVG